MNNSNIPSQTITWEDIPRTENKGETGSAFLQTKKINGLRVTIVEFSENYKADHWCEKGHIVYCLQGEVVNQLKDGTRSILTDGTSYIVSDDIVSDELSHRSITRNGVRLLIIDGDFLRTNL